MSKSLKRVRAALEAAGSDSRIRETENARTAEDAAGAVACAVDQIAKSIIFLGADSGKALLFITAGSNQVDSDKAARVAGEPLTKADAAAVRAQTGFAIGGVSPVGMLTPVPAFIDPRLMDFDVVWAAAGTPSHVFSIHPEKLAGLSGAVLADFTVSPT